VAAVVASAADLAVDWVEELAVEIWKGVAEETWEEVGGLGNDDEERCNNRPPRKRRRRDDFSDMNDEGDVSDRVGIVKVRK
jgi:hypothetical protein